MFKSGNVATEYVKDVMKDMTIKKLKEIKDAVKGHKVLQIISKPDMLLQCIVETEDISEQTVAAYMYAHWQLLHLNQYALAMEEDIVLSDIDHVLLYTDNSKDLFSTINAFKGDSLSVCKVSMYDDLQCISGGVPKYNNVGYHITRGAELERVFTGCKTEVVRYVSEHCKHTVCELYDKLYDEMLNPFKKVSVRSNEAIAETFSRQCALMKRLCATTVPKVNFTRKACYK